MATGFLTDTTVCIGCKACEVACKQWNQLPADGAVEGSPLRAQPSTPVPLRGWR